MQKLSSVIHWINHYLLDSANSFPNPIYCMVIYLVESVIHRLNNQGQLNGDLFDTNDDTDYEIKPVHLFMPGRFPQK